MRQIAQRLGRSVSTVSMELARNSITPGSYSPYTAHMRAERRLTRPKNVSVMTRVCGLLSETSSKVGGVRSRFVSIYVGVSRIIRV